MKKHIEFVSKDNKKVKLDIEVKETSDQKLDWETLEPTMCKRVSISGEVGGCCGQIYDEFEPTEAQARLVEFWKKYHLNDCCPGTKRQTEALEGCVWPDGIFDYKYACICLESKGLLEDMGYKYGTGWLAKSFPENELEEIISEIEKEEESRKDGFKPTDLNDKEAIAYIEENSDLSGKHVLALLKNLDMSVSEIDCIEEIGTNMYEVYGTEYYVGTKEELEKIAREYLDRDQWVAAVECGATDDRFSDWVDSVIGIDGFASVLNRWDGTSSNEQVNGTWYCVCRA